MFAQQISDIRNWHGMMENFLRILKQLHLFLQVFRFSHLCHIFPDYKIPKLQPIKGDDSSVLISQDRRIIPLLYTRERN